MTQEALLQLDNISIVYTLPAWAAALPIFQKQTKKRCLVSTKEWTPQILSVLPSWEIVSESQPQHLDENTLIF